MDADDLYFVWERDDIDSSFFEDTDNPRPLYVALLYRGEHVVEALGGIDADSSDPYRREIEQELLDEFEARRESVLIRGEN